MPQRMTCLPRLLLTVAVAAGLAACQSGQQNQPTAERPTTRTLKPVAQKQPVEPRDPQAPLRGGPIRVALLAPLSGDFADAGRELANGAAMAMFDTTGVEAELFAFDTRADQTAAQAALDQAVRQRADVVVGPLFGANAKAIAPGLEAAGLTALVFSNDSSVVGPNVWVTGRTVEIEATRIVRHAAESGARVVAVFGRADAVGEAAAAQAAREAAAIEGFYVRRALYAPGTDYTAIARSVEALIVSDGGAGGLAADAGRLKSQLDASVDPADTLARLAAGKTGPEQAVFQDLAAFYGQQISAGARRPQAVNAVIGRYMAGDAPRGRADAVLLTVGGAELSTIAPMFQLYDADAAGLRLLGLSTWSAMDPARARELHGGRFADELYNDAFDAKYERLFGAYPSELAAVSYDAVRLALAASERAAARPVPSGAVAAAGEIPGARGPVRVSAAGLALRPMEVIELGPAGFVPVDPARIVDPAEPPAPFPRPGS